MQVRWMAKYSLKSLLLICICSNVSFASEDYSEQLRTDGAQNTVAPALSGKQAKAVQANNIIFPANIHLFEENMVISGSAYSSMASGDFNQDGYSDLVLGLAEDTVDGVSEAGRIRVLYGSSKWPAVSSSAYWHQGIFLIRDQLGTGDNFGHSLAVGDFDHDGYDDLAIGVPGDTFSIITEAGSVSILYGSPTGLTDTANQLWRQGRNGLAGIAETGDRFGTSLEVGDFNNDGFSDLAIGTPYEKLQTFDNAGAISILYGSANGLSAAGNQWWREGYNGLLSSPTSTSLFGLSLSAGDFNQDGITDLAVGVPYKTVSDQGTSYNFSGYVSVLFSKNLTGLDSDGNRALRVGDNGPDEFGGALASGDFNNDGLTDLAVGSPSETEEGVDFAGAVNVFYGKNNWINTSSSTYLYQGHNGLLGGLELVDEFGSDLLSADVNGDGYDDLIIGVKYEDIGALAESGAAHIVYGTRQGISTLGNRMIWPGREGVSGIPTANYYFGKNLIYFPPEVDLFPWEIFLPAMMYGKKK